MALKWNLRCECGKQILFVWAQADSVTCAQCGKSVAVPAVMRRAFPPPADGADLATTNPWRGWQISAVGWGIALVLVLVGAVTQTAEEAAFSDLEDSPSLTRATDFLRRFGNSRQAPQAEAILWSLVQKSGVRKGYQEYLNVCPNGVHASEARHAIATIDFEEFQRAPGFEAAGRFFSNHPGSEHRREVRRLLVESISAPVRADRAPDVETLRKFLGGLSGDEATLSLDASSHCASLVKAKIEECLLVFGIATVRVRAAGDVRVEGKVEYDRDLVYSSPTDLSRVGRGASILGPYGEEISVAIHLHGRDSEEPLWSARFLVKSPDTVSYTTTTYGGVPLGGHMSQDDVHQATEPLLRTELGSLLQYR
ncbi:MAG: hypothetical protein HY720_09095 [Planctomycetes bacterium]|nr:hypothetical protein [Planctomycetota bacterium]